ncbi:MAG: 50S ribosomal protein L18 [Bacillota bacterium]|jgi:large subunit ribosomal protein L18|nr:50S ribosomal protein L18 [Bacillota bacterium]MDI9414947.1 50S ribosomal protein L18 [Bacillota bacterium]NLD12111.1 50S ribosomal protein L18 [Bacillota bacterium]HAV20664.1 50S ribosomal protein L18 [Bacillota bacterium]HCD41385.1 50S ribosomal protein L18 [Bacillota bacterium]
MFKREDRKVARARRHRRIRKRISGTQDRPRLAVARSLKHIYAQIIDDQSGTTLAFASSLDPEIRSQVKNGGNVEAARLVGKLIGEKAQAKGIKQVVFDRGGNLYHGRVAALAEGARESGLEF